MIFNINEYIKVRLTDYGRKMHRKNYDEFWGKIAVPRIIDYIPPIEDEDGWSTWQMWTFMEQFGRYMRLGEKNVIETNIIIVEDHRRG